MKKINFISPSAANIFIVLIVGVLSACASQVNRVPPAAASSKIKTLAYYTGDQASFEALQAYSSYLDIVSADVFGVDPDGRIFGTDDLDVVAFDKTHGIATYACISNYNSNSNISDFDPQLAYAAIVTHKDTLISALVELTRAGGYDGVNIDFENIASSGNLEDDRAGFSAFIHQLAAQLHAAGFKLAISVPGKTEDSPDNSWAYPFDLAALGKDADYIQLMTYDQHGPWSEPGPVSGAGWVEACVVYAASQVDPARLLIGLPAYGYDWDLDASDTNAGVYSAESFPWTDVLTLLTRPGSVTQWDAEALSPSILYTLDGHEHVAWYENADSIRAKAALVPKYNLGGLSMWSLGQEDESFWQAAVNGIR